jgi:Uma2 family endonuclease
MTAVAHQPHLWSRREFERLVTSGGLQPDARLELIDGEILDMAPQQSLHSTAVRLVEDALRGAFGAGFDVRAQLPLAIDDRSEPEPDVAVVTGGPRDYRDAHPTTAVLVVEIADSSLALDRGRKLALYARNGIADYWILNLVDDCLEVYRQPMGARYASPAVLDGGDSIAPLAQPEHPLAVADLLP